MTDAAVQGLGPRPDPAMGRLGIRRSTLRMTGLAILLFAGAGGLNRLGGASGAIWLLATVLLAARLAGRPGLLVRTVAGHRAEALFLAYLLGSSAWSLTPAHSAAEAAKMIVTFLTMTRFAGTLGTRQVLLSLLMACGVGLVLSFLNLGLAFSRPVFEIQGAFLGIYTHKTMVATAGFLLTFVVAAIGLLQGRRWPGIVAGVATFPIASMALSATGQIGYGFTVVLYALWSVSGLRPPCRAVLSALALAAPVLLLVTYAATGGALLSPVLEALGKNATLTGRTVIWLIGLEVWTDAPLFGLGMDAFWTSPAFRLQRDFIEAYVDRGLNGFHNGYIEVAVGMGLAGLLLFLSVIVGSLGRLVRAFLATGSREAAIWLSLLACIAFIAVFEDALFNPRSLQIMLLFLAASKARHAAAMEG